MGQFQRREPRAGQLGSATLKPQDAEQDLQAGPPPTPAQVRHPWGQSWLHSVQDLLKKPWKVVCAASHHPIPSLTSPWESPKPKLPQLPTVRGLLNAVQVWQALMADPIQMQHPDFKAQLSAGQQPPGIWNCEIHYLHMGTQ